MGSAAGAGSSMATSRRLHRQNQAVLKAAAMLNTQVLSRLALESAYPPFDLQLSGPVSALFPLRANFRLNAAARSLGLTGSDAHDAHRRATGIVMATNVRLGGVSLHRLCFRVALVLMVFKAYPVLALGWWGDEPEPRTPLALWAIKILHLYVPSR